MWPGALILFELIAPRATAQGVSAYAMRVRSLFPWAVKRGADACAVGGGVYAAALGGEVWVFCFPTVACGWRLFSRAFSCSSWYHGSVVAGKA